jgi:hypothetical protein
MKKTLVTEELNTPTLRLFALTLPSACLTRQAQTHLAIIGILHLTCGIGSKRTKQIVAILTLEEKGVVDCYHRKLW